MENVSFCLNNREISDKIYRQTPFCLREVYCETYIGENIENITKFSFSIADQGWLLEYISEYLNLKVPFVRDYAFQSLVLTVE